MTGPIALLVLLICALAYLIHEHLDLARFNRQAREGDQPIADDSGVDSPDGGQP